MPITFEEVTAEVAPERSPAQTEPAGEGAAQERGDGSERIQRELALRATRLQRAATD